MARAVKIETGFLVISSIIGLKMYWVYAVPLKESSPKAPEKESRPVELMIRSSVKSALSGPDSKPQILSVEIIR